MSGLLALAFAAGMVAPVNPCGFALLPAWITLSLGDTTHHTALAGRLARALQSGVALTIGFAGTLVAAGLIVSAGARAVIDAAPWLGLATGVVLVTMDSENLREGLAPRLLALAAVSAALLGFAAAAAWLLARHTARPIRDLAATADQMADGDLTARAAPSSINEVQDVSVALSRQP